MQELLRINLTTQMASYKKIVHDREALVEAMRGRARRSTSTATRWRCRSIRECSAVKLAAEGRQFAGPCLVVQVSTAGGGAGRRAESAGRVVRSAPRWRCAQEEPFWKEIARFYEQAPHLFGHGGLAGGAVTLAASWIICSGPSDESVRH